ncbi:MAG: hypothetical protein KAR20_07915 [Candidatus Heimdallarchaeota archaeon]|nr:hypothetical protein [Candidatus Heimdallarchaeota archaeon]
MIELINHSDLGQCFHWCEDSPNPTPLEELQKYIWITYEAKKFVVVSVHHKLNNIFVNEIDYLEL